MIHDLIWNVVPVHWMFDVKHHVWHLFHEIRIRIMILSTQTHHDIRDLKIFEIEWAYFFWLKRLDWLIWMIHDWFDMIWYDVIWYRYLIYDIWYGFLYIIFYNASFAFIPSTSCGPRFIIARLARLQEACSLGCGFHILNSEDGSKGSEHGSRDLSGLLALLQTFTWFVCHKW